MLRLLKKMFEPMPDDMTSTKYHIKQIERRREPAVESSAKAARPGFVIDYESDGYVKLNLHIRGKYDQRAGKI